MYVTIEVMLLVNDIRISKSGTFPLRNRLPEIVALDWIKEIKKELNVEQILKVVINGEEVTEKVKKAHLN